MCREIIFIFHYQNSSSHLMLRQFTYKAYSGQHSHSSTPCSGRVTFPRWPYSTHSTHSTADTAPGKHGHHTCSLRGLHSLQSFIFRPGSWHHKLGLQTVLPFLLIFVNSAGTPAFLFSTEQWVLFYEGSKTFVSIGKLCQTFLGHILCQG